MGQQFGLGGIVTSLRRVSLGNWHLETLALDQEVEYHMRGQEGMMKRGMIEE
ncbi:MAG: hypothetical protein LBP53_05650 [Candidatus Peribacteria bacterium]|nr:hypothetical protein [Candidatus Peribacteria bacterium]